MNNFVGKSQSQTDAIADRRMQILLYSQNRRVCKYIGKYVLEVYMALDFCLIFILS